MQFITIWIFQSFRKSHFLKKNPKNYCEVLEAAAAVILLNKPVYSIHILSEFWQIFTVELATFIPWQTFTTTQVEKWQLRTACQYTPEQ